MKPPDAEPHRTERTEQARQERLLREAEALRANLRKRKAQVRARSDAVLADGPTDDTDAPPD